MGFTTGGGSVGVVLMEDVPMRGAAKSEKTGERSAQTIKNVLKSVEATVVRAISRQMRLMTRIEVS